MKAPVSWIREYVDLPADVTTEQLAARLTALGLKLEAIEKPGEQIRGPLVVGKVLTMEAEPQKNGKTIEWCTVDVGDANGSGEPQGIVCGAHNFAPGDLVVVILPGRRAARRLRDLRAQDLRPRVGRDDLLLAASSGSARTTRGSSCCPRAPASPARRPRRCSASTRRSSSSRSTRTAPTRCRCAASPARRRSAYDAPYTDPAQREVPAPNDDGYPVVIDDPAGCPVFVARVVSGFDPAAPTPDWMAQRLAQSRACARSRWRSTSPTT